MTDINDIYSSGKNLKASDLKGHSVQVTINNYTIGKFDEGKAKIVLTFHGKEKALVVNVTNAMIIGAAYGSNPDNWIDKVIEIYPDKTNFQNKLVDCLRVRVPAVSNQTPQGFRDRVMPPATRPMSAPMPTPLEDEIPF